MKYVAPSSAFFVSSVLNVVSIVHRKRSWENKLNFVTAVNSVKSGQEYHKRSISNRNFFLLSPSIYIPCFILVLQKTTNSNKSQKCMSI